MNLQEWLTHCERLHPQNIDMGLERVAAVAKKMGLQFACPVLTVAGTNGKGSTCAMLESILREAGYTGELRAQGDVLVDQIAFMRRCGFDSFAPEASLNPEAVARALSTYDQFYQKAADAAVPVWKLRHG